VESQLLYTSGPNKMIITIPFKLIAIAIDVISNIKMVAYVIFVRFIVMLVKRTTIKISQYCPVFIFLVFNKSNKQNQF